MGVGFILIEGEPRWKGRIDLLDELLPLGVRREFVLGDASASLPSSSVSPSTTSFSPSEDT